jgi:hypothetical protein
MDIDNEKQVIIAGRYIIMRRTSAQDVTVKSCVSGEPYCTDMKTRTVSARVNAIRKFSDFDLKTTLNLLQNLGISRRRNKGYRKTLGTETTGTTKRFDA